MLDINLLRNDIGGVAAGLAKRGVTLDTDRFDALERERKDIQTRTQDLQARRNALSKEIGAIKGRGGDASAQLAEVAGFGDALKRLEAELERVQGGLRDFLLDLPNLTARLDARRRLPGRQRRGAPLGHAPPLRLRGQGSHRSRRGPGPARFRHRREALRRALLVPARRARAAAPRARPVHARHAHPRARLHRVLHALHRQRRDAGRDHAAAEVRDRHVLGEERRRRRRGRDALPDLDLRDHADQLGARRDPARPRRSRCG